LSQLDGGEEPLPGCCQPGGVGEAKAPGVSGVDRKLKEIIDRAYGKKEEKLKQFYQYIYHQQDGLLDLERRGYSASASLGEIEGNVDKLVVHRMKGRGCCWKLTGASVMLPICQYKDKIRDHAFRYRSLDLPEKPSRRLETNTDVGVYLQTRMPIFYSPDQDKPWVGRCTAMFIIAELPLSLFYGNS